MQCAWGTSADHRGAQGSVCGHWKGPQAKGRAEVMITCDVCIHCNLQNLPTRTHTHARAHTHTHNLIALNLSLCPLPCEADITISMPSF